MKMLDSTRFLSLKLAGLKFTTPSTKYIECCNQAERNDQQPTSRDRNSNKRKKKRENK